MMTIPANFYNLIITRSAMNKEGLIKGYNCRSLNYQARLNTKQIERENSPPRVPTQTAINPPQVTPFLTVQELCEQATEVRGFKTAGFCRYNGADVELLSNEGTKHRQIILDFKDATRNVELRTECADLVPVELMGSVSLVNDVMIKISVSFCKNLSDFHDLAAVLKYYETVKKIFKIKA